MQHSQIEPIMNHSMNQPFTPIMNLMNIISKYICKGKVQSKNTPILGSSLHFWQKRFKGSITPNAGGV